MLAELMGSDEKKGLCTIIVHRCTLLIKRLEETKGTEKKEPGWAQKWVAKVVDNIQIFVDRVHIRYEDDRTCPAVRFSFIWFVVLQSLT